MRALYFCRSCGWRFFHSTSVHVHRRNQKSVVVVGQWGCPLCDELTIGIETLFVGIQIVCSNVGIGTIETFSLERANND
jgi:hypothetical protein